MQTFIVAFGLPCDIRGERTPSSSPQLHEAIFIFQKTSLAFDLTDQLC